MASAFRDRHVEKLRVRQVVKDKVRNVYHPADSSVLLLPADTLGLVSTQARVTCPNWNFHFQQQTVVADIDDSKFWVIG